MAGDRNSATGRIEAIFIAAGAGAPPRAVDAVRAVPGRGLDGDRYFDGTGHFYAEGKSGQDITLIESEALEALRRDHGIELAPAEARRNVLTSGVSLNDLVGARFRVGGVECLGRRLCDPCAYLEGLTEPGVLRGLARCGGLRADILSAGEIRVGEAVGVAG